MTAATESFLREIEEAITLYRLAVCNDLQNITHERVAARAALLVAIEKYAEDALAASRAENAALAKLIDRFILADGKDFDGTATQLVAMWQSAIADAKALRAGQQKGER